MQGQYTRRGCDDEEISFSVLTSLDVNRATQLRGRQLIALHVGGAIDLGGLLTREDLLGVHGLFIDVRDGGAILPADNRSRVLIGNRFAQDLELGVGAVTARLPDLNRRSLAGTNSLNVVVGFWGYGAEIGSGHAHGNTFDYDGKPALPI